MNQNILDYLKSQRTGVLAVEMTDGAPHAATVHFAHTEEPLVLYFETGKGTRKGEVISTGKEIRASFVIGTTESEMKSLQLDGIVKLLEENEKELFTQVYLGKFEEKKAKMGNAENIPFKFIPTWWRYTDFKTPQGKLILTSTDQA